MILDSETRAVNAPYLYSESQKYLPVACNRLSGRLKKARGKFALGGISLYLIKRQHTLFSYKYVVLYSEVNPLSGKFHTKQNDLVVQVQIIRGSPHFTRGPRII